MFKTIEEQDAFLMDAISLAFVGDAVHALFIKNNITITERQKTGKLHVLSNSYLKAASQSQLFLQIKDELSEKEQQVANRARNAKNNNIPKNSDLLTYKNATCLEAVIGYNFLFGNHKRVKEIIEKSF